MIQRVSTSDEFRKNFRTIVDMLSGSFFRQIDRTGEMVNDLADTTGELVSRFTPPKSKPGPSGGCEIPEPCWMPADLGEFHCSLCKGGRGTLEITVTNSDFRPRKFDVVAAGADAGHLKIQPGNFTLGPKERRTVTVTFDADLKEEQDCGHFDALVWVMGCRNHFLRWIIDVGKHDHSCCIHLDVSDQPDYEHHWYDHFYCNRRCFGPGTRPRIPEG